MNNKNTTCKRAVHDKHNPYFVISRFLAQSNLSAEAKGIMLYILSMADTWVAHPMQIAKKHGIGKKIYNIINELIENGYCVRQMKRDEKGRHLATEYFFYENPIQVINNKDDNKNESPNSENQKMAHNKYEPLSDFPHSDNPNSENQDINKYKEENNYKEEINKPPIPPKGEDPKGSERVLNSSCEDEIKTATDEFIECIKKHKPDYVAPRKKDSWYQSMKKVLHDDKRSLHAVIKVLDWALQDNEIRGDWNGWASKVLISKNPIEYLRKKYDGIETQSRATKFVQKHKFATEWGANALRDKAMGISRPREVF